MAGKWDLNEGWLTPKTTSKYPFYFSITRGSQLPVAESSHYWSCESGDNRRAVLVCWHLSGCCWKTCGAGAVAVVAHPADKGKAFTKATAPDSPSFWGHLSSFWEDDRRASAAERMTTEASPPSLGSRLSRDWAPHRHTDTKNLEALDGISQHPRHKQDHISYHQGCHQPQ